jgi:hypothetical protein
MAQFILRNCETDESIPINLTFEQECFLVFLESEGLDLSGFEATRVSDGFQEV